MPRAPLVRTNATVIAALAVIRGEADAMICGVEGRYMSHLRHVREIIGFLPGVSDFAALALMITSKGAYFIADTQVRPNPSAEELAEMAALAAIHVQRFNLKPKIAFVSHSDFGSYDTDSSRKMRRATALLKQNHPEIEADGEMQGDTALSEAARKLVLPHSKLEGEANILIMPNLDTANVAYQMIKVAGRCASGRADPDRSRASGAYPDAVGDRARRPQHDRGCRGRSPGASRPPATDLVC